MIREIQEQIQKSYALNWEELEQLRVLNRIKITDVYEIKQLIQAQQFPLQSASLTLDEMKVFLDKVLKRNIMSSYLFERLYVEMDRNERGAVSALDWLLALAMLTHTDKSERTLLTFALLDTDEDGCITQQELQHFIHIISTLGWCYDRHLLYKQTRKFPPNFERKSEKEMTKESMEKAGVTDDKVSWEGFAKLPIQLV